MIGFIDRLPTWLKVALWLAASAFVDAAYNAFTQGQATVAPAWVPIINVVLVAVRDLIRSQTKSSGS